MRSFVEACTAILGTAAFSNTLRTFGTYASILQCQLPQLYRELQHSLEQPYSCQSTVAYEDPLDDFVLVLCPLPPRPPTPYVKLTFHLGHTYEHTQLETHLVFVTPITPKGKGYLKVQRTFFERRPSYEGDARSTPIL